jgi:hypothetical protein
LQKVSKRIIKILWRHKSLKKLIFPSDVAISSERKFDIDDVIPDSAISSQIGSRSALKKTDVAAHQRSNLSEYIPLAFEILWKKLIPTQSMPAMFSQMSAASSSQSWKEESLPIMSDGIRAMCFFVATRKKPDTLDEYFSSSMGVFKSMGYSEDRITVWKLQAKAGNWNYFSKSQHGLF